jgi:hypothetical protein
MRGKIREGSRICAWICLLACAGCGTSGVDHGAPPDLGVTDLTASDAAPEDLADPADLGASADLAASADLLAAPAADLLATDLLNASTGPDLAGVDLATGTVAGWSVRKRLEMPAAEDVLLEEVPTAIADDVPKPSRIVAGARSWVAPAGWYLADFCVHPSGALSLVLIGAGGSVTLVRLDDQLAPIATLALHDPQIANDPNVAATGDLDLVANRLTLDAARLAAIGEAVVVTVFTSWNSVVAYRTSVVNAAWTEPQRTLVEPPTSLMPSLPIGGSFDTFGAMTAWFRCLVDTDESGNSYVALWANQRRIKDHVALFHDGLVALPGDPDRPSPRDSDVLLTKLDPAGQRLWSRVVGTIFEDEPYALRAQKGSVAVVGRARRQPGFDNSQWDAFVAVASPDGDVLGSRTLPWDASSIALAVDAVPGGGWVIGGSDGWTQNPGGLSILTNGAKLLFQLPSLTADSVRLPLSAGPRHNEVRTVRVDGAAIAFGGHEDGPLTHSGDGDPTQIRANGILGQVSP